MFIFVFLSFSVVRKRTLVYVLGMKTDSEIKKVLMSVESPNKLIVKLVSLLYT